MALNKLFSQLEQELEANGSLEKSMDTLRNYDGKDWIQYIRTIVTDIYENNKKQYYKFLVHKSSSISMYVVTWDDHSESKIHTHPEKGCIMKLLSGKLVEETYVRIKDSVQLINKTDVDVGDIGYKFGDNILHKIYNVSDTDLGENASVSRHIYADANYICKAYKDV